MRKISLLFFLFTFSIIHAQYHQAKLLMASGEVKEGLAKLPSNQLLDSRVEFKETRKGEATKFEDDEVAQLLITSKQGNNFLFERNNAVYLQKFMGKEYVQEKKNMNWMLLVYANPSIQIYSMPQKFRLDDKGRLVSIKEGNALWDDIYFLFRRPDQEKAYIVSGKSYPHARERKALAIYFKDYPEFVERIENKEFKKVDLEVVADAFHESLKK